MHNDTFQRAVSQLNRSTRPVTISAARAVLVDGMSQAEAARAHGMQRQAVSRIVGRIQSLADADDWVTVTVTVPRGVADQIEALAERYR